LKIILCFRFIFEERFKVVSKGSKPLGVAPSPFEEGSWDT